MAATAAAGAIIATFNKNKRDVVRLSVNEFAGRTIINLRVFYPGNDGKLLPGDQGIALAPHLYPDLADAVRRLGEHLVQEGLLPVDAMNGASVSPPRPRRRTA